jgi:NitT/TauT family transport system ATP-binding protein
LPEHERVLGQFFATLTIREPRIEGEILMMDLLRTAEPWNKKFISLERVTKTFMLPSGPITVISDLNLQVERGKTLCIVGPSGCGKTTILNLISGFLTPTSGLIKVDGVTIRGPGPDRAVVFQKDSVFPWLTVRQNLEYGPRVRGISRKVWAGRVDEYLEKVGLQDCANHYPKQLSGGMRKRVDIARAYTNQPNILLMDEPFGSLDVMTKEVMQKDLLELSCKDKKSLIFITHDIEEAVFLGDDVLVMMRGPANIERRIQVPFSKPREVSLKLEPEFQTVRKEIDAILKGKGPNG